MNDILSVDIAVVGAGPAGSTAAAALATRGYDVALLEKDVFPRDKLCGEFLSPESIDCLQALGCYDKFAQLEPAVMENARIISPDGQQLSVSLPGKAYGLSRRKLDKILFDTAGISGARIFDNSDVRALHQNSNSSYELLVHKKGGKNFRVKTSLIIAAFGRRSRLDRKLERSFFASRSNYVAFKKHHVLRGSKMCEDLHGAVELYVFAGGYCGISYVEDDIINVCTMFERHLLDGRQASIWSSISRQIGSLHPALKERLSHLEPLNRDMVAVAQIPFSLKERYHDGIFFVGDAAAMVAPLAGDGQAMAMESALLLADLIDTYFPAHPAKDWDQLWRRSYEPRLRLGQGLQRVITLPELVQPILKVLRFWPWAANTLVNLTRTRR